MDASLVATLRAAAGQLVTAEQQEECARHGFRCPQFHRADARSVHDALEQLAAEQEAQCIAEHGRPPTSRRVPESFEAWYEREVAQCRPGPCAADTAIEELLAEMERRAPEGATS